MATSYGLFTQTRSTLETALNSLGEMKELKRAYTLQEEKADAEIRALELRLKDIEQERLIITHNVQVVTQSIIQMEAVIADLRKTLSPIKGMPNETLYQIFSEVCRYYHQKYETPAPLILGSVCSRWRSLMFANTLLWNNVVVFLSDFESDRSAQYKCQILCFLERGQCSQQSLILWDWTPARYPFVRDIFETHNKSPTIPFKSIYIEAEESFDTTENLDYLQANVVSIDYSSGSIRGFIPIMRYAAEVCIYGLPPDWGSLPWINLRAFTLVDNNTISQRSNEALQNILRDILRGAPYMSDLCFQFDINRFNSPQTPQIPLVPMSHSNLECIAIDLSSFYYNGVPFGIQLNAPKLRKLKLYRLKRQVVPGEHSFYQPWTAPTHLVLHIRETIMEAAELVRWYPSVQTLEIEIGKTDALFTFMHTLLNQNDLSSGPLPLPKLTTLHLKNTDLRGETLLTFLDSRLRHVRDGTPGVQALTKIYMYNTPDVTHEDWKLVTKKLEEGRVLNEGLNRNIVSI